MNEHNDDLDWDYDSAIEERYADKLNANEKARKKRNIKERLDEHFERKRVRIRQRELDDFESYLQ